MSETELSAREREQLLAVLRELDGAAPVEKRGHNRRKVLQKLWIRKINGPGSPVSGVALFQATLVNVSMRGVGLHCKQAASKGDKLVLPLQFKEGGGWLVLCEVRNCRKAMPNGYRIGAIFSDRIEDPSGDAKIPMDWVL